MIIVSYHTQNSEGPKV